MRLPDQKKRKIPKCVYLPVDLIERVEELPGYRWGTFSQILTGLLEEFCDKEDREREKEQG